jgi:hypothetical protein
VYEYRWEARADDAAPACVALDRGYPGVIAIALTGDDDAPRWASALVGPELPVIVALRRDRLLVSALGDPAPHLLLLVFVDGDAIDVWYRLVAPVVGPRDDVGFAGPFLAAVAGTDTYVDEL